MVFKLEKIDLSKINNLYLLRGYSKDGDEHYCMIMALLGDEANNYQIKAWLQNTKIKQLTRGDMVDMVRYLQGQGMTLHGEVLKEDFNRFHKDLEFEGIRIVKEER